MFGCNRPQVMGIVNVTPDSFSDGGRFRSPTAAFEHAQRLIAEGADILDVGGESTRPGAPPVGEQEEMDRVIPVLEVLRGCGVPLSVDTMKPAVMRAALAAGAVMVNDVMALRAPGALQAVAASDCAICLMHMQNDPLTMQVAPHYEDVVVEVRDFLAARIAACEAAGIARSRLCIDPGFGFGKTRQHNIALLRSLDALSVLDCPVLVGLSRKSVLGQVTGNDVGGRLHASLAAAVIAVMKGARIVRVHDVRATVDALGVVAAIQEDQES